MTKQIAVFSRKMAKIPHLGAFLGAPVCLRPFSASNIEAVAGWGQKGTTAKARAYAAKHRLPFFAVEDGFLRSLDLGVHNAIPCSLVLDKTGIYYDATAPSDLETMLEKEGWEEATLMRDAQRAIDFIRTYKLSKYNHAPDAPPFLLSTPSNRLRVLIIDQTVGDSSVALGLASAHTFEEMLRTAHKNHPGAAFFIKTHPDVLAGKKQGYLTGKQGPHATIIGENYSPLSILREADIVYTVTSQMGFEALLWGKEVHCFGMPFYAGWGLTHDHLSCIRRTKKRKLTELFAAAYMLYARYVNPISGQPCTIFDTLRLLATQRQINERNRGYTAALGFKHWKKPHARAFLQTTHGTLKFFIQEDQAINAAKKHKGRLAVWASSASPDLPRKCAEAHVPLVRLEDGFLRSVGLGSDYGSPLSLVLDIEGIYYDPSNPCLLESLFLGKPFHSSYQHSAHVSFTETLLRRARALRAYIVEEGITKYNLKNAATAPPLDFAEKADGAEIILVPGQVEDDASVRLGGMGIHTNEELLRAVRAAKPNAYILYKPHPDVEKGNRIGKIPEEIALQFANTIICDRSMAELFPLIDSVHTLTSLTGFEALLRGIDVHTYGGPFYAGWGLTTDRVTFPRRNTPISLDALVAGALILYPCYYDWRTHLFCTPEDACYLMQQPPPRPTLWVRFARLFHFLWKPK